MIKTQCRGCGVIVKVALCKPTRKIFSIPKLLLAWLRKIWKGYDVYDHIPRTDKGCAVTGVPCPKCGAHKLRRLKVSVNNE